MTKKEFIGAYNIGHRDGKAGDYTPNDYDDIFQLKVQKIDQEIKSAYICSICENKDCPYNGVHFR